MKALALRSALSARVRDGRVVVVDGFSFDKPKTKEAVAALKAWNVDGKALVVLTTSDDDVKVAYAFRNLPHVHVLAEHQLNVYDILNADWLVFGKSALEALQARNSAGNTAGVRGAAGPTASAGSESGQMPGNEQETREAPRSSGGDGQ